MKKSELLKIVREAIDEQREMGGDFTEAEASKELENICGTEQGKHIFRWICCKLGWECCRKKMNKCWD